MMQHLRPCLRVSLGQSAVSQTLQVRVTVPDGQEGRAEAAGLSGPGPTQVRMSAGTFGHSAIEFSATVCQQNGASRSSHELSARPQDVLRV
ncbi:hypothetical protein GBF38_002643 [Nibea albiflora]|uniref:Uncharacterized protein n=1 Tax=Nibea albiflora TaxID=240163 RepID=A0ACB7EHP3_NIBAL|nr:hypothetical protein GBF38_002643 [Nibea albiflora]